MPICSCGMELKREIAQDSHLNSLYHRQRERVVALLKSPCISFAEIGRRVGVSRERVRQLAERLGVEDPEVSSAYRATVCNLEHSKAAERATKSRRLIKGVVEQCEAKGYKIQLVELPGPGLIPLYSRRKFYVNGHLCYVAKMYTRTHNDHDFLGISGAGPQSADADFMIYCFEEIKLWLIIPRHLAPKNPTLFSEAPNKRGKGRAKNCRHDWRRYFNKWEQLR